MSDEAFEKWWKLPDGGSHSHQTAKYWARQGWDAATLAAWNLFIAALEAAAAAKREKPWEPENRK
jgi:hypothetical protein